MSSSKKESFYFLLLILTFFNTPNTVNITSALQTSTYTKNLQKFTMTQEVYFHVSKCTFNPDLGSEMKLYGPWKL